MAITPDSAGLCGSILMFNQNFSSALALATVLTLTTALAPSLTHAQGTPPGDPKYPDWSGQWKRPPGAGIQWDQTRRPGLAQQPPLTPEYQAIFEASLGDQARGGP